MPHTIDSSILYTREDGTQGFVHDSYLDFFLGTYFSAQINSRQTTLKDVVDIIFSDKQGWGIMAMTIPKLDGKSTEEVQALLEEMLQSDCPESKRNAANLAGQVQVYVPGLADALDYRIMDVNANKQVLSAAVWAIGECGYDGLTDRLKTLCKTDKVTGVSYPYRGVRLEAVRALVRLGKYRDLIEECNIWMDSSEEVREEAAKSLGRMGYEKKHQAPLMGLISDYPSELASRSPGDYYTVRYEAISAFCNMLRIGNVDTEFINEVRARLFDMGTREFEHTVVKDKAREALGQIEEYLVRKNG
ncbi:MAG: HEAT repeat domain-containing protein [Nanoarchaeota archaeon]|nr:HEAT repeat domain-containing protein [Nanoarchaeota archaeon]